MINKKTSTPPQKKIASCSNIIFIFLQKKARSNTEDVGELDFACKAGQLIAVYADASETQIRFWIAEATKHISKPMSEKDEFPIIYYKSIDDTFTSYRLENGRRAMQVKYNQCLGTISAASRDRGSFTITPLERDRVQNIAQKEDLKGVPTNSV